MLNALRASVILLLLVCTAHAGEGYNPPAPAQQPTPQPTPSTVLEPSGGERLYAETAPHGTSYSLADAALELLTILPALL